MKKESEDAPVRLPTDSPQLVDLLDEIEKRGVVAHRPQPYQIKVGPFNYYPKRGKITVDGDYSNRPQGPEAFLALIDASKSTLMRKAF